MENTNNKSFEQMAKDAESRKRMQELAGIQAKDKSPHSFQELIAEMKVEIRRIGDLVTQELIKNKNSTNE